MANYEERIAKCREVYDIAHFEYDSLLEKRDMGLLGAAYDKIASTQNELDNVIREYAILRNRQENEDLLNEIKTNLKNNVSCKYLFSRCDILDFFNLIPEGCNEAYCELYRHLIVSLKEERDYR